MLSIPRIGVVLLVVATGAGRITAQPTPTPAAPTLPPAHPALTIPLQPGMPASHPTVLQPPAALPATFKATLDSKALAAPNERELLGRVLRELLEEHAAAQGIEASDADVAAWRQMLADAPALRELRTKRRLDVLHTRLTESEAGSPAREKIMAQMRELGEESAEAEAKERNRQALEVNLSEELRAKRDQADTDMARRMVRRFRINQSLYERHGGRLVQQQLGAEPVDAYAALVDEAAAKGRLKVEPPASVESLKKLLEVGVFVPAGQEAEALKMPWEQQHYAAEKKALEEAAAAAQAAPPPAPAASGS